MQQESASYFQNESSSSQMRQLTTHSEINRQYQEQGKLKIIKKVSDVKLRMKKGKNTPTIHVYTLRRHMKQFQHHYKLYKKNQKGQLVQDKNYFQFAVKKVWQTVGCPQNPKKQAINTSHLWHLFGGNKPDQKDQQEVKQFIINRMNAKVLELIYQKYLLDIVFGSAKISDKLTTLAFIQEYRKRLPNPLLCGKLQFAKPLWKKDQKNDEKALSVNDMPEKKEIKRRSIRK